MKKDKEYLMLREEILHLDIIINNTITLFYTFISAIILFVLERKNSATLILVSYIIIIPAYRIVVGKRKNIFRIAAYLYVFLEGDTFNWERRQRKMPNASGILSFSRISSINYPFLFVSTAVMIIFAWKFKWNGLKSGAGLAEVSIAIILYIVQLIYIFKNRKIKMDSYIKQWEEVKRNMKVSK